MENLQRTAADVPATGVSVDDDDEEKTASGTIGDMIIMRQDQ